MREGGGGIGGLQFGSLSCSTRLERLAHKVLSMVQWWLVRLFRIHIARVNLHSRVVFL